MLSSQTWPLCPSAVLRLSTTKSTVSIASGVERAVVPRRQELAKRQPHAAHVLVQIHGLVSIASHRRPVAARNCTEIRIGLDARASNSSESEPAADAVQRAHQRHEGVVGDGCRRARIACQLSTARGPDHRHAAVGADAVVRLPIRRRPRPCTGRRCERATAVGAVRTRAPLFGGPRTPGSRRSHGTGGWPRRRGQCHLHAVGGWLRGLLHRQRAAGARPRRFHARREEAASGRRATAGAAALRSRARPARAPLPAPPIARHSTRRSRATPDPPAHPRRTRRAPPGLRPEVAVASATARPVRRSPGMATENVRNVDS